MQVITKEAALTLGLKRYFTGKPCKRCHIAERYTSYGACVECAIQSANEQAQDPEQAKKRLVENMTPEQIERKRARDRAWTANNPDKMRASNRAYYEANQEALQERNRAWWDENRDEQNARRRSQYEANRDKHYAQWKAWHEKNRDKWNAACARDHARRLQAMPPWADSAAIAAVYAEAQRLTESTGVVHHVDHIVPLQSPIVCGLHVHWNLRPLPASENIRKSNKLLEICQ